MSKLDIDLLDRITVGDAREICKRIPDESIGLIVCDPVYWEYWQYAWLDELAHRVLIPGRSVIAQVGDAHRLAAEVAFQHLGMVGCPLIHEEMRGGIKQLWDSRTLCYVKPYIRMMKPGASTGWMPNYVKGQGRDKRFHEWGDTPAVFTMAIERLTEPGDVVLDPFTGSGTVPAAAIVLGRRYIGIEIDPERAETARKRLEGIKPLFTTTTQLELGVADER